MERKSKMRAAIIEGKQLPIIMNDEQRTASTANDGHPTVFNSSSVATRMKSVELVVNSSLIRILDMWCSGFKDRAGSLRSGHPPLALQPGEPNRLPTSGGASMPLVVERPFKAAGDVVTSTVTHCCHSLSRGQTSSS